MTTRNILVPPEVQRLLDVGAPVCIGLSGGKDSTAVAWAVSQALLDYPGPKLLIHADLGTTEWVDSWPSCLRIADRTGWDIESCRRPAGDMMDRWEGRWASSVRRYCAMETVAVVLPWSTPAMRFCQSELKVDPITSLIKRRFGKAPVLNVTGVRGEESATRAKQSACAPVAKLPPGSLAWRPIHHWALQDVWDAIAESGIIPHEAYGTYGSSRVSCRFCILANEADLKASLKDPEAMAIYRRMCELELESGFAFQGSRWLTSLAPELLDQGPGRSYGSSKVPWGVSGAGLLTSAQVLCSRRREAEAEHGEFEGLRARAAKLDAMQVLLDTHCRGRSIIGEPVHFTLDGPGFPGERAVGILLGVADGTVSIDYFGEVAVQHDTNALGGISGCFGEQFEEWQAERVRRGLPEWVDLFTRHGFA